MSMTPEEFLEKENAVREIAGAFGFLYELVRDFRRGFVETSEMGGETADLLAAQLFQAMILPRILDGAAAPDAGEIKLRAAAHRALEVLDAARSIPFHAIAAPPVSLDEVQQAVDLLREALGDGT
jgi:hypothetical protein